MDTKIVEKDIFYVIGIEEVFAGGKYNYEEVWNKFMVFHNSLINKSVDKACYGISWGEEKYFVGMNVPQATEIPDGLVMFEIPAASYAEFECKLKTILETKDKIFTEWLPNSGYTHDEETGCVEIYPQNRDDESTVVIQLAISK